MASATSSPLAPYAGRELVPKSAAAGDVAGVAVELPAHASVNLFCRFVPFTEEARFGVVGFMRMIFVRFVGIFVILRLMICIILAVVGCDQMTGCFDLYVWVGLCYWGGGK